MKTGARLVISRFQKYYKQDLHQLLIITITARYELELRVDENDLRNIE